MSPLPAKVFYFPADLPTIERIVELLTLHTAEEITCDAEQDSDGVGAVLLSQAIDGRIVVQCVNETQEWLVYIVATEKDAGRKYLTDAFQFIMELLGGIDDYARKLSPAARQPWRLAKAWYQRHYDGN